MGRTFDQIATDTLSAALAIFPTMHTFGTEDATELDAVLAGPGDVVLVCADTQVLCLDCATLHRDKLVRDFGVVPGRDWTVIGSVRPTLVVVCADCLCALLPMGD